jgi:hypothetical protein
MICAWVAGAWRWFVTEKIWKTKNPTRVGVGLGRCRAVEVFPFTPDAVFIESASPSPSRLTPCAYDHRFKSDVFGDEVCGAIHLSRRDGKRPAPAQARTRR